MIIFLIILTGIGWFLSYYYNSYQILILAVVISIMMNFTSYFFSDKIVLKISRAKKINLENNKELYRIVENLCITSGLPMPKIFVLPEESMNAFATGRDTKHSSIAITEGLLKKLNLSELEAVIAHELSHINNRDTLLQASVVVLVGIVVLVSDIFIRSHIFGFGRKRDDNGNNQIGIIITIIGIVLIILSPLIAKLIQLAISRKREYLADNSAVLLTRYKDGLIGALEKISDDNISIKFSSNAISHLYIVNPFKAKKKPRFSKFFNTHPPIEERIKVLKEMDI
jgi:heat shock protein HtpX